MQKYGMVVEGQLVLSGSHLEGYKPIEYAEVPEFDQLTQAVVQGAITEDDEKIYVGINIVYLELDEDEHTADMP